MRERIIEKQFTDYLKGQKGYQDASFLYEAAIHSKPGELNERMYIADLLILDTDYNNYLAVAEFKSKNDKNTLDTAYNQVAAFLYSLDKKDLPAYLVVPSGEDFDVYLFTKSGWNKIEKEEFPQYQTLQSKAQADNKSFIQDLTEKKYFELKKKKELLKSTAWSTLLSLIAGIITVIVFSLNIFNKSTSENAGATFYNDSTAIKINNLSRQFLKIEEQLEKIENNDSLLNAYVKDKKLNEIDQRLKSFESAITSSPDRVLKLQEMNFQFRELQNAITKEKEISDIKVSGLRDKLDQVIVWTSGLIITIIGSIIGFAINAFKKS